jgi:hypothetical protein
MIILRRDKIDPLTRDELDGNFMEISKRVSLTGNENIGGVKTFTSSPIVPDLASGDTSLKAANANFVSTTVQSALIDFAATHPSQDNTKVPLAGGTMTGDLIINANLIVSGNITETSDMRVKNEIKHLESSLYKVKLLNGVSYIKVGQTDRNIGLIAQEVKLVVPEVVSTDSEGMLSVSYSNLVALLIEAIKEQDIRINNLVEKLDSLI